MSGPLEQQILLDRAITLRETSNPSKPIAAVFEFWIYIALANDGHMPPRIALVIVSLGCGFP